MDIKEKTRKEITTPEGYNVTIRKLNLFAFLETGTMPDILGAADPKSLEKKIKSNPDSLKSIMKICLIEGVVGGDLIIVDKPPRECQGEEISFEEVPQEDAIHIINEVMEFSDLTGGAANKAKPFSKAKKAIANSG